MFWKLQLEDGWGTFGERGGQFEKGILNEHTTLIDEPTCYLDPLSHLRTYSFTNWAHDRGEPCFVRWLMAVWLWGWGVWRSREWSFVGLVIGSEWGVGGRIGISFTWEKKIFLLVRNRKKWKRRRKKGASAKKKAFDCSSISFWMVFTCLEIRS